MSSDLWMLEIKDRALGAHPASPVQAALEGSQTVLAVETRHPHSPSQ